MKGGRDMFTFQYKTMSEAEIEKLVTESGCFIIVLTNTSVTVSGSEAAMKKLKEKIR